MIGTPDWPYDARRDDPLTAHRIPVVGSPYPGKFYEVALVLDDFDLWGPTLRPDEAEILILVSYLEFRMQRYGKHLCAQKRRLPLDTDSGANTLILQKRGQDDWCYRKRTFRQGPAMYPEPDGPHLPLVRLLDQIYWNTTWDDWKATHPEVFSITVPAMPRSQLYAWTPEVWPESGDPGHEGRPHRVGCTITSQTPFHQTTIDAIKRMLPEQYGCLELVNRHTIRVTVRESRDDRWHRHFMERFEHWLTLDASPLELSATKAA
jgi:hypothetical protein